MDTGSVDIGVANTYFDDIGPLDIDKVGIDIALIQLVSAHRSSLSRYTPFSPVATGMLYIPCFFLQQLVCSAVFLIMSYKFKKFTIQTSWCTYNLLKVQALFRPMTSV